MSARYEYPINIVERTKSYDNYYFRQFKLIWYAPFKNAFEWAFGCVNPVGARESDNQNAHDVTHKIYMRQQYSR